MERPALGIGSGPVCGPNWVLARVLSAVWTCPELTRGTALCAS